MERMIEGSDRRPAQHAQDRPRRERDGWFSRKSKPSSHNYLEEELERQRKESAFTEVLRRDKGTRKSEQRLREDSIISRVDGRPEEHEDCGDMIMLLDQMNMSHSGIRVPFPELPNNDNDITPIGDTISIDESD